MKKPNLQRLAQRSKIYLRKASPTILSGLGAAGVIVTSVLAVRATPKALRKIRADAFGRMYASEEENRKIHTGRKLKSVKRVPDVKMSTYNYKPAMKRNLPYQRRNF